MRIRRMIEEFLQQVEEENGIWNGKDDRVRRQGTLKEIRDSESGLSILEESRLERKDGEEELLNGGDQRDYLRKRAVELVSNREVDKVYLI